MGTFNPNPRQAPPQLTPSIPPLLCSSNALWRVRHFRAKYKQKVLRVAAAESGNNKYSNDPRWSAMGRSLSAASWPVTSAPFVARNNAEDATRRHLPCSNLPLNHFNFKQIDITLPVPPSCRAAPTPLLRLPCVRSITQSSGRNWKSPGSFPLSLFRLCPHLRQLNNYQRRRQR